MARSRSGRKVNILNLFLLSIIYLPLFILFGLIFAINGHYSIEGLRTISQAVNFGGSAFWAAASAITMTLPGTNYVMPVIPWLFVLCASLLQVFSFVVAMGGLALEETLRKMLYTCTIFTSLYDFGTTYMGIGTVPFIAQNGMFAVVLASLFLTFAGEGAGSITIYSTKNVSLFKSSGDSEGARTGHSRVTGHNIP